LRDNTIPIFTGSGNQTNSISVIRPGQTLEFDSQNKPGKTRVGDQKIASSTQN